MTLFGASKTANALAVEMKETDLGRVVEVRPQSKLETQTKANLPSNEALQTAARLRVLLGATGQMVAVTGVAENDGATQLASSIATGLAAITESKVLVIDANVNAPRLHEIFGVPMRPGLLEVLEDEAGIDRAVRGLDLNNLFVLPLGHSESTLAAVLSKPESQSVFDALRKEFRYIVVDTGLVAAGADGVLLAALSDGVVTAVAAGIRRRHEVLQFQQELKRLRIPLLGMVLTHGA